MRDKPNNSAGHRVRISNGLGLFRAVCRPCGFVGPRRDQRAEAERDADDHSATKEATNG